MDHGPASIMILDFYSPELWEKEYISVVLSQPVSGNLLWQPQEANTDSDTGKWEYSTEYLKNVQVALEVGNR